MVAKPEHGGTKDEECTQCGHFGNGQVPGCPCRGCDDSKPSDDKLPMTGVWYRATDGSGDQCVVMDKDVATQMAIITRTGGHMATLTFTEFAAAWELV